MSKQNTSGTTDSTGSNSTASAKEDAANREFNIRYDKTVQDMINKKRDPGVIDVAETLRSTIKDVEFARPFDASKATPLIHLRPKGVHLNTSALEDRYLTLGLGQPTSDEFIEYIADIDVLRNMYLVLSDRNFYTDLVERIYGPRHKPFMASRYPNIESTYILEALQKTIEKFPIKKGKTGSVARIKDRVTWGLFELIMAMLIQSNFVQTKHSVDVHLGYRPLLPRLQDYKTEALKLALGDLLKSFKYDITTWLPKDSKAWTNSLIERGLAKNLETIHLNLRNIIQTHSYYDVAIAKFTNLVLSTDDNVLPTAPIELRGNASVARLAESYTFIQEAAKGYDPALAAKPTEFVLLERAFDSLATAVDRASFDFMTFEQIRGICAHSHVKDAKDTIRAVVSTVALKPVLRSEMRTYIESSDGITRVHPETITAPGLGNKLTGLTAELDYRMSTDNIAAVAMDTLSSVCHNYDKLKVFNIGLSGYLMEFYAMSLTDQWTLHAEFERAGKSVTGIGLYPVYYIERTNTRVIGLELVEKSRIAMHFVEPEIVLVTTPENNLTLSTTDSGYANMDNFLKLGLPRAPEIDSYIAYDKAWVQVPHLRFKNYPVDYASQFEGSFKQHSVNLSLGQILGEIEPDIVQPWINPSASIITAVVFDAIELIWKLLQEAKAESDKDDDIMMTVGETKLAAYVNALIRGVVRTPEGSVMFSHIKRLIKTSGDFADLDESERLQRLASDKYELSVAVSITFFVFRYLGLMTLERREKLTDILRDAKYYHTTSLMTLLKDV